MGLNNITGNTYSDEWYTDAETAALAISLLAMPEKSSVMLPFDGESSQFRIQLEAAGHSVIYGVRDWLESEYQYDYLITNPPFSLKDKVIEKVLRDGRKSTLILPLDALGGVKRQGASFHSIIMTFNSDKAGQVTWE